MIYIDTSVALAHLLAEDRQPPGALWAETLFSSRLLEYEIWVPLHARGLAESYGEAARWLIGRVAMLELSPIRLRTALGSRIRSRLHPARSAFFRSRPERTCSPSVSTDFAPNWPIGDGTG